MNSSNEKYDENNTRNDIDLKQAKDKYLLQ